MLRTVKAHCDVLGRVHGDGAAIFHGSLKGGADPIRCANGEVCPFEHIRH